MSGGFSYAKWDDIDSDESDEETTKEAALSPDDVMDEGNRYLNNLMEREELGDEVPGIAFGEAAKRYAQVLRMTTEPELLKRAHLNGATALFKMKEWAKAAEEARIAYESEPKRPEDQDKAIEIWEGSMTELREEVDARFELADMALKKKDFKLAASTFGQVADNFPGRYRAAALTKLAGVYEAQGKPMKAAEYFALAASDDAAFSTILGIDALHTKNESEFELEKKRLGLREKALSLLDGINTPKAADEALEIHKAMVKDVLKKQQETRKTKKIVVDKDQTLAKAALSLSVRCRKMRTTELAAEKEKQLTNDVIKLLDSSFRFLVPPGKNVSSAAVALLGDSLANELAFVGRFEEAATVAQEALSRFPEKNPNEDETVALARAGCALSGAYAASQCPHLRLKALPMFIEAASFSAATGRFDAAGDAAYRAALIAEQELQSPDAPTKDDEVRHYGDMAATYFRQALDKTSNAALTADLQLKLAKALLAAARPADAVSPVKEALSTMQKTPEATDKHIFDALELLGDALALAGNFQEAADVLDRSDQLIRTTNLAWPSRQHDAARTATALATARQNAGDLDPALWEDVAGQYHLLGDAQRAHIAQQRADKVREAKIATELLLDDDDDVD